MLPMISVKLHSCPQSKETEWECDTDSPVMKIQFTKMNSI